MRHTGFLPYLGPALVLYLVAWVVSLEGETDTISIVVGGVAVLLSFFGYVGSRTMDANGSRRIGLLSLCASAALIGSMRPDTLSLAVDVVQLIAFSLFAGLLMDLTFSVPDRIWPRFRTKAVSLSYLVAFLCASGSIVTVIPYLSLFGEPLLLPPTIALVPLFYTVFTVLFSLILRIFRRQFGSSPEALASNSWAVMGLIPSSVIAIGLFSLSIAGIVDLTSALFRLALMVGAAFLVSSHIFMVDIRRRLSAGKATRKVVTATLTMTVLLPFVAVLKSHVPNQPIPFIFLLVATLFAFTGVYFSLQPYVRRLLAPFGARLLDAVNGAIESLSEAQGFDEVSRVVLGPMREASGSVDSRPLLFSFDPPIEASIDAAGQSHLASRSLPQVILQHLNEKPGEIIIRNSIEACIIRQPPIRPLATALIDLDALCVVPLVAKGELEGCMIIPKGKRLSSLSLEEISALYKLSRLLSTFISVLSAQARAQQRANDVALKRDQIARKNQELSNHLRMLRAEAMWLKAGKGIESFQQREVVYSEPMSYVLQQIEKQSKNSNPVLMVAEHGVRLDTFAYMIHQKSGRRENPFIVADCGSVPIEQSGLTLFGEKDGLGPFPGWLPLANGGTLVLFNLPALPVEVQRTLAWALATGQAQRVDGGSIYNLDIKIIGTSLFELSTIPDGKRLDPELTKRMSSQVLHIPPLRERSEDLSSLTLIELDRAARILGRQVVGIEPKAFELLKEYDWPGNHDELRYVIEKAVLRSNTERVQVGDLPEFDRFRQSSGQSIHQFSGTFEAIERRMLEQAMIDAAGNKSQAARILGLKRTTFLDKLRRHSLD